MDAVSSIIEQSFKDWEMICVNDGSTDESGNILDWFAVHDSRVRVIHQNNAGIVSALNNGIAACRAPLVCRMDCDDIAMPQRLDRQTNYMREHDDCIVLGSAILEIDEDGDPLQISRLPTGHDEIVNNLMHRKTGHFHPTTMIRTEQLQAVSGYRSSYQWIEDHDLWLRLASRGALANLEQILLCYRQHAGSVCWKRSDLQRKLMNRLLNEAYRAKGSEPPREVILSETMHRSPAGPGKWARAAAKGGYARTALKQLRRTLRDPQTNLRYKLRMFVEVGARVLSGAVTKGAKLAVAVPQFPQWNLRLVNELHCMPIDRQVA